MSTDSIQETRAIQEIDRASKKLLNYTTFTHLEKDGSNFIAWKKNTSRAMKALLNIKDFWDAGLPVITYVDTERDKLAAAIIANTIHEDLKNVTDDADTAVDAMRALQKHFQRGGRTNQFSLFAKLMNLRLDLTETEMLAHMTSIDAIVAELESTGFTWTSESVRGLLYQLHMPSGMTKEINKDLDQKFAESNPNFSLEDVKSAIQIHLAREKTASETISINSLSTGFEAMSVNRTPAQRRIFPSSTFNSPRTPSSN